MHFSTKTYGANMGFSACFRQWRAKSHCNKLHGYALEIKLGFAAKELDERNWVVDFGALKVVKTWIEGSFDHRTLISQDDPELNEFISMHQKGLININVVPAVGCEAFAQQIADFAQLWLQTYNFENKTNVKLVSVEVREHGANSAGITFPATLVE